MGQHPRKAQAHQGGLWRKDEKARQQGRTDRQGAQEISEEEVGMPKVGNKHYAYTPKGMAAAKKAAKKSGKKVSYRKKK